MSDADVTGQAQRTHLSRKWLVRIWIFSAVCIVFGLWGFYDAKVAYPNRGAEVAEKFELEYLTESEKAFAIERASIADPAGELAKLKARETQGQLTPVDLTRLDWLRSLAIISRATPVHTTYADAAAAEKRRAELDAKWKTRNVPKALDYWDIPVQWVIMFLGLAIGIWLLLGILIASTRVYRWNAATTTLSLPGGHSLTPSDIREFDKRKWDKFYVTLQIREGHPTLSGKGVKLDLLRYQPLEEWVLELERIAFPPAPEAAPESGPEATSPESSLTPNP